MLLPMTRIASSKSHEICVIHFLYICEKFSFDIYNKVEVNKHIWCLYVKFVLSSVMRVLKIIYKHVKENMEKLLAAFQAFFCEHNY